MDSETHAAAAVESLVLTPREHAVLQSLAAGHSGIETAHTLGVSYRTLKRIVADLQERFAAPTMFTLGIKAARLEPPLDEGNDGAQLADQQPKRQTLRVEPGTKKPKPASTRRLTFAQAEEIRRRYAAAGGRRGMAAQLAREYGLTKVPMRELLAGRTYRLPDREPRDHARASTARPTPDDNAP